MSYSWKYCLKEKVKNRLLIEDTDATYDSDLDEAVDEASRFIDLRLERYEALPPANPITLSDCCADLASGIFKRRHMPQDMDAGWWGQGTKKLDDYVAMMYKRGRFGYVEYSNKFSDC